MHSELFSYVRQKIKKKKYLKNLLKMYITIYNQVWNYMCLQFWAFRQGFTETVIW